MQQRTKCVKLNGKLFLINAPRRKSFKYVISGIEEKATIHESGWLFKQVVNTNPSTSTLVREGDLTSLSPENII